MQNIPAWGIAIVRSLVQAGVSKLMSAGFVIALIEWVTTNIGFTITQGWVESLAFGATFTVIVGLTNYLGKLEAFQWVNKVVSLWLSNSAAVYDKTLAAGGEGRVADEVVVDMGGEDVPADRG
jgi:hypothetical protein